MIKEFSKQKNDKRRTGSIKKEKEHDKQIYGWIKWAFFSLWIFKIMFEDEVNYGAIWSCMLCVEEIFKTIERRRVKGHKEGKVSYLLTWAAKWWC